MTKSLAAVAILWAIPCFAQSPSDDPPVVPPPAVVSTGDVTTGFLLVDNSTNSSKLVEYGTCGTDGSCRLSV